MEADLDLTAEEHDVHRAITGYLHKHADLGHTRAVAEAGGRFDVDVWRMLARHFEVGGLLIEPARGGSGPRPALLAAVAYELGRSLTPTPLLTAGVLVPQILEALAPCPERDELLAALATGRRVITLALTENSAEERFVPGTLDVRALTRDGQTYLRGTKHAVAHAEEADALLVLARDPAGEASFYVVDADAVQVEPLAVLDLTRPTALVTFNDAPARPLRGDADRALASALAWGDLVVAAEHLGAMARCIETAVDHAKVRMAFGQPIGAFQGIKHPLADRRAEYELGMAGLREALACSREGRGAFGAAATVARCMATESYLRAATGLVHVHGGLGYTWEHDAHLFLRHAMAGSALLGTHSSRLGRLWELTVPQREQTQKRTAASSGMVDQPRRA